MFSDEIDFGVNLKMTNVWFNFRECQLTHPSCMIVTATV